MKRFIIFFVLIVCTSSNALADEKKEACIKTLGAGIYNSCVETYCDFKGEILVSGILNQMYTKAGCRSIVSQDEVNASMKEITEDSVQRYNAMGGKSFCSKNKKAYYDLANSMKKNLKLK